MSDNETRKTIKKLKEQRDEARTELEGLKSSLQQAQQNSTAEIDQATAKVATAAATESNGLRNELATKEHRIEVLEVALLKTEQERDTARNELTISDGKYVGAQSKIEALTKLADDPDIKSLRKRLHGKTVEIDKLKTQLKQTEEECRALAVIAQKMQAEILWLREPKQVSAPVASVTTEPAPSLPSPEAMHGAADGQGGSDFPAAQP
jgi:chromosome segregation ATPase